MTTPRSNVSAVVVRDRLYAVGGFSGKTFLNTIEYLDPETNEWTTFVPQQEIDLNNIEQLKEAVENGFHNGGKSVSPVPQPPPVVVVAVTNGGGGVGGVNGHKEAVEEEEEGESSDEDRSLERRPSVKVIKGGDVLYSNGHYDQKNHQNGGTGMNGKMGKEEEEEHPRVADEVEADEVVTTIVMNGSSS